MQDVVYAVALASIYLTFALGLSLSWGTINVLNFAHGSIFMMSAFVGHELLGHMDLPWPVLLLIGTITGALLAAFVHVVAFGPILRRSSPSDAEAQIMIAGIGIAGIPVALANRSTGGNPFGYPSGVFRVHSHAIAGARVSNIQILTVVLAVVAAAVIGGWLRWSRKGLALRAIGADDETAAMMGINRARLALATMAVSGGLAGAAGVLLTISLGAITPESGDFLLLKAFAVVVLGGVGSVSGVVVGSVVLAASETFVLTQTSGTWVDAVSFAIIFVLLLIRPQGLFGRAAVVKT